MLSNKIVDKRLQIYFIYSIKKFLNWMKKRERKGTILLKPVLYLYTILNQLRKLSLLPPIINGKQPGTFAALAWKSIQFLFFLSLN